MPASSEQKPYDVVIIGGALSGASTAFMLLQRNAGLRVLIVEKNTVFKRRVGESTVEISSYFLSRVLGLTDHLNQEHLIKQGLRFWFHNDKTASLADCSEIGPSYNARLPGFQVDRSVLDEEVLRKAVALGAELLRPAKVIDYILNPGGLQDLRIENADKTELKIQARWIVDASGVAATLARREGWLQPNRDHPIASVWGRWSGVKSWDSETLAMKYPSWGSRIHGMRNTATNHLFGYGWWAWWIPLKGGDTSIGIVFDQRLIDLPPGEKLGDRLRKFLDRHPIARELLEDATWHEGDVHLRRDLAYSSSVFAGDGFSLVGDAAGFIDPFYSPGMDWIAFTTTSTTQLILDERAGKPAAPMVAEHNRMFSQSYVRWFEAIYKDKYQYLGDYELLLLAFRLDLAGYYIGVVSQPFRYGWKGLHIPVFGNWKSAPAFHLVRAYNRRFARIARHRRKNGTWGRRNANRYFGFMSYLVNASVLPRFLKVYAAYLALELREGWRTWFARQPADRTVSTDVPSKPLHEH